MVKRDFLCPLCKEDQALLLNWVIKANTESTTTQEHRYNYTKGSARSPMSTMQERSNFTIDRALDLSYILDICIPSRNVWTLVRLTHREKEECIHTL